MQFEAIKSSHGVFSPFGDVLKHLVSINAFIVAHGYFCAVNEGNSCAFAKTDGIQKEDYRHKNAMFYLYKTIVRHLFGKFLSQMYTNIVQVVMLKIFECSVVKEHQYCNYFAV